MTIFHGKIHYRWPFSIAMLNYQRVITRPPTLELPRLRLRRPKLRLVPEAPHPVPVIATESIFFPWKIPELKGFICVYIYIYIRMCIYIYIYILYIYICMYNREIIHHWHLFPSIAMLDCQRVRRLHQCTSRVKTNIIPMAFLHDTKVGITLSDLSANGNIKHH